MTDFPLPPELGDCLAPSRPSPAVLDFLSARRSAPLPLLGGPGPDAAQLNGILQIAARVPDHRRVVPWRFLVFKDAEKQEAGQLIAARFAKLNPAASSDDVAVIARKFSCAPVVVALISAPDLTHKTPVWEQELVAGAVGFNLLLAANAAGFAGVWLTDWHAFDDQICAQFGVQANERIAGFFHLGSARENIQERPRPQMDKIVQFWRASN